MPARADKILLFCGCLASLAPESNGLRVLVRLGLLDDDTSYARLYRSSLALEKQLPAKSAVMQEAHVLLHQHGATLCKRSSPHRAGRALSAGCVYFREVTRQRP
jgi:endonuclease III-like uncharacterized protein